MEAADPAQHHGAPPLVNPPPQIFGAFTANGSPIAPSLPGPVFTDDEGSQGIEESNEAKRRRIARVNRVPYIPRRPRLMISNAGL